MSKSAHQRGQAMIEYTLILIVVLLTAFFFLQFAKGFQDFSQNYFGNYLDCLLRTGELPALGAELSSEDPSNCNAGFEAFTIANGRPPRSSVRGGAGGSSARSGGDGSASSRAGRDGSDSGSSGGAGGGGRARVTGGDGLGKMDRIAASEQDGQGAGGSGDGDGESNQSNLNVGGRTAAQTRLDYRAVVGERYIDEEDADDGGRVEIAGSGGTVRQNRGDEANRIPANFDPAQKKKVEDDEGISFGNFLRYLIIVIIVLVILLFFGGQLNQITKGWQK